MAAQVERGLKDFIRLEVLMTQASVTLRRIFREQWENWTGGAWVNSPTCGHYFITTLQGRKVYKKVNPLQRKSLEKGDVNNWDLLTLSEIFLEVYSDQGKASAENDSVVEERKCVRQLVEIQHKLSHDPTKSKIKNELGDLLGKVSTILAHFGSSEEKLEAFLVAENIGNIDFGPTPFLNSVNVHEANRLKAQGNKKFKAGHLDEALERYTKAIDLSDISDEVIAILYYNRAAVYIKIDEDMKRTENDESTSGGYAVHEALENARKAVTLRPNWWKAHFRLGNVCEVMGKVKEASLAFVSAAVLNPVDKGVKTARDNCVKRLIREYLDPYNLSASVDKQIEKIIEEEDLNVLVSRWEQIQALPVKENDQRKIVLKAHRMRYGLEGMQSYKMAAMLYQQAAMKGNVEGMLNLAMMSMDGLGVKKDIKRTIELLNQAAAQPITKNGLPNLGVAEAEYELARLYMEGDGVPLNMEVAISWLKRALEHGHGFAAYHLGVVYLNDNGVKRDFKLAVHYWKLAVSRKVNFAMEELYELFLAEKNLEQAKKWFRQALKNGSAQAQKEREKFENKLLLISTEPEVLAVSNWERVNGLDSGELPFLDRFLRMMSANTDFTGTGSSFLNQLLSQDTGFNSLVVPSGGNAHNFDLEELAAYAEKGSKTARTLHAALKHQRKGLELLNKGGHEREAISHAAAYFRMEPIVDEWSPVSKKYYQKLVEQQMSVIPNNTISPLCGDLHVCYAYLSNHNVRETVTLAFLDKAIAKYPDEACLHLLRVDLLRLLKECEEGLEKCQEALKLFPYHVRLHFLKANLFRSTRNAFDEEIMSVFEDYLRVAEADDRHVPEAHYKLAFAYLLQVMRYRGSDSTKDACQEASRQVTKHYLLGQKSETLQLPCFLPYKSETRENVAFIMKNMEEFSPDPKCRGDSARNNQSQTPDVENASESVPPVQMKPTTDPLRLQIIQDHRQIISDMGQKKNVLKVNKKPQRKRKSPLTLSDLKLIMLRDMDQKRDRVYHGSVLKLTSIEDAIVGSTSIQLVVQDENKDVRRCLVYNFNVNLQEVQDKFGFGCQFSLVRPDMRMMKDGKPAIRVDDPMSQFVHSGRDIKSCRFCGKGNSSLKCSHCRKAFYCGRECQTQDWKLLKHSLICRKMP